MESYGVIKSEVIVKIEEKTGQRSMESNKNEERVDLPDSLMPFEKGLEFCETEKEENSSISSDSSPSMINKARS